MSPVGSNQPLWGRPAGDGKCRAGVCWPGCSTSEPRAIMSSAMSRLVDAGRRLVAVLWPKRPRGRRTSFTSVRTVAGLTSISPAANQLVVVASGPTAKWLRFICPCGCRQLVALNLMRSHSPRWTMSIDSADRVTVHPSIDSTTCGAHFFIRSNRIEWC